MQDELYINESKKPKKVVRNDEGEVVPEHCSCGGKVGVFIEGEPIYKCTACGKYYGTMPFKRNLNEGRMSVLYHKSGYFNRKSILKNGLIPQVGPSYQAHWDDAEDLKPYIFLYDHNKVPDGEYDSTYDDDIYAIDVKQLDKSSLSKDPDRDMKGCYVYSAPIPPSAIKLVYKGSKKDSGDLSLHSNIYESIDGIKFKEERVNSDEICVNAYQNGGLLGYMILVMHNDIYSLESEISETDDYDTADEVISRLNPNKGVIELADVDVSPRYRNMGVSKKLLEYVLNKYSGEQFYLRVCPTDGVEEKTLAASVGKYGFTEIDSTDNGTFMIKKATIMESKKKTISINESQLRDMIAESIKKALETINKKP